MAALSYGGPSPFGGDMGSEDSEYDRLSQQQLLVHFAIAVIAYNVDYLHFVTDSSVSGDV